MFTLRFLVCFSGEQNHVGGVVSRHVACHADEKACHVHAARHVGASDRRRRGRDRRRVRHAQPGSFGGAVRAFSLHEPGGDEDIEILPSDRVDLVRGED